MPQAMERPKVARLMHYYAVLGPFAEAAYRSPLPMIFTDSLSADSPILLANDAFLAMTGFTREAAIGRAVTDVFGDKADPDTIALLQKSLANGNAGLWQISIKRANQTTFLGVIYVTPVCDQENILLGHIINFIDLGSVLCLTREMEEIYPKIYDQAPGFIAISNGENHRFTYANESYKKFVKRDDLIGQTVAEALPEAVDQGFIAILDEVYRTGNPFRAMDMPIKIWNSELESHEQLWIDVVYQPMRDDNGTMIGLFCEGYDVTEVHEANAENAVLQMKMIHVSRVKAMGTLAATLAHELNQPLTAISNYLAGTRPIDGKMPDVDRLNEALAGIREASDRAAGIIDHLRQLTKHRKPVREPFSVSQAVADCIRLTRTSCPAEITFDNRVASNLIIYADQIKIERVLINLMQNACDALVDAEPALVTIDAFQDGQNLTVSVADNGPGVDPAAVEDLFSWTESSKDDGMGIGLSICRTIIETYRGSIWLHRSGPEGADFRFSVPLPDPAPPV